jgi:hypothetical protein
MIKFRTGTDNTPVMNTIANPLTNQSGMNNNHKETQTDKHMTQLNGLKLIRHLTGKRPYSMK